MKKSLALYLALLSTYSFAYVGDIPISQSKNTGTKQTETHNLMSSMNTKVRIYNDSSQIIKVSAYNVDSSWDYANSWQPSKGYSVDMKDLHNEKVPAHSWIDIYSGDNSNFAKPSIKYNIFGGYISNAISFTFANVANYEQPMDFYHGYDDNYNNHIHFTSDTYNSNMHENTYGEVVHNDGYDNNLCTALVITDNSAVVAPNLNRDTCDVTRAHNMFSIY